MWCPKCISRFCNVGGALSVRAFRPCVETQTLHTFVADHPVSHISARCRDLITPLLATKTKQKMEPVEGDPEQLEDTSGALFDRLTKAGRVSGDPVLIRNISKLRHMWEYLHKDYGFRDQRGFLLSVAKCRRFVGYSLEETVRPAMQFLMDMGFTHSELERVVIRFPKTLSFSVEGNMRPKFEYYRSLGLTDKNMVSMVKLLPQLLCYGLETNVKPSIEYFEDLGLCRSDIRKAIVKYPALLGLSLEQNIKPTIGFFLAQGATKENVAQLVKRVPSVMGLSLEHNIEPKYFFASQVLDKSVEEIFSCPTYFSLSLENRILFRVAMLDFLGADFRTPAIRTLFLRASKDFERDYGLEIVAPFKSWWGMLEMEQKADSVRNRTYMSDIDTSLVEEG